MVSFSVPPQPTAAVRASDTLNKRRSVPQPFFAHRPDAADAYYGWRTARPLAQDDASSLRGGAKAGGGAADDNTTTSAPAAVSTPSAAPFARLRMFTWNIDFSCPESVARMRTALAYMEPIIAAVPETDAMVIFFQEMTPHTLHVIHETEWVRRRFYTTDQVPSFWLSTYGTTTLVDKRLVIAGEGVRRLRLRSEFGRDGLFVDLLLQPRAAGGQGGEDSSSAAGEDPDAAGEDSGEDSVAGNGQPQTPTQENGTNGGHEAQDYDKAPPAKVLRLCNVHLESLASNPPIRPTQFATLTPHLQPSDTVHASMMAGDTNANRPYDATLPAEHGLSDAYLALGGVEGDAAGHTWGYQSGRTHYPPTRLDKILFAGDVRAAKLERLGVGVMVDDVGARTRLENIGEEEYVTDHYGLVGTFEIGGGMGLARGHEAWKACCGPDPQRCSCARPGAFDPAYGIGMI
jgi:tyrosyl-DNA phosphodiesterase 2